MIQHGDLFDVLPTLAPASIDACVTDPPYGLAFMGQAWDTLGAVGHAAWAREVYRVLKPGAHLLACGGPRTFHRLTCGLEDAGFEIRDCLAWLYGSGFPKSLNVGNGWGTGLKPAYEPIILARKPLAGTVAANVRQYGTGAINVDGCRIETDDNTGRPQGADMRGGAYVGATKKSDLVTVGHSLGRWPANVLLDEAAAAMLDAQSGESQSPPIGAMGGGSKRHAIYGHFAGVPHQNGFGDMGGASRFFYTAKASPAERDRGHDATRNGHPTVKPLALMRWLVRLVTPAHGTVLDPFAGSGTTGMACRYEGVQFIGIERDAQYVAIAQRRIADCLPLFDGGLIA
jgi:site-specific DNA-methyltransferase (adenine-specific)